MRRGWNRFVSGNRGYGRVLGCGVGLAVLCSSLVTASASAFVQQATLETGASLEEIFEGDAGVGDLGTSVAVSSDGDIALVGAANSAWVFTRSGSTWTQQA